MLGGDQEGGMIEVTPEREDSCGRSRTVRK